MITKITVLFEQGDTYLVKALDGQHKGNTFWLLASRPMMIGFDYQVELTGDIVYDYGSHTW